MRLIQHADFAVTVLYFWEIDGRNCDVGSVVGGTALMMCTLLKGAPLIDVSTSRTLNWNTSNYQLGVVNHQPLLTAALYNNQPGQNGTPLRGRVVAMGREVLSSHQHLSGRRFGAGRRCVPSRHVVSSSSAAAGATVTFKASGATGSFCTP